MAKDFFLVIICNIPNYFSTKSLSKIPQVSNIIFLLLALFIFKLFDIVFKKTRDYLQLSPHQIDLNYLFFQLF